VEEPGAEGASNELPWASVFDSAANMRALSAIQADGFRAASELVDRFVRMASAGVGVPGSMPSSATAAHQDQGDLFGATGLEPVVASWWSMVDQLMRVSAAGTEQSTAPSPPSLDLAIGRASGLLQMSTVAAGTATAELWLHNAGPLELGKIRLRCGELAAHDGARIGAEHVGFEPDLVPMPARSSRGVIVSVELGDDAQPGTYRGTLMADGQPDLWLPIELVVKPLLP
jgi:hypothetical protein